MCQCSNRCNCNITSITKGEKGDSGTIGATGATGATGPAGTMVNGWKLDGNTEGTEKYFGTNDNFDIPLKTNNVVRGIFNKIGNFGFGESTVDADTRVHIKGFDATSSYFSLKVKNSDNTALFYVRNDSTVIVNSSTIPSAVKLYVRGGTSDSTEHSFIAANSGNSAILNLRNDGAIGINGNSDSDITLDINNTAAKLVPLRVRKSDTSALFAVFEAGYSNFNSRLFVGGYFIDPTAMLQVQGLNTLSTTFSVKINDGAATPLNIIKARNDGFVIQRAVNSAIADADLANNEMSGYINEAGNLLIFKVKYSTGVVKTTSLALI